MREEIREAKKGSQEIKKKGYCAKQNSRKKDKELKMRHRKDRGKVIGQ